MKKLLTFALILVMVSCEVNDDAIFYPQFEINKTTMFDVENLLGVPNFKSGDGINYKYLYKAYFVKNINGIERIDSEERFFFAKFYDSLIVDYGYIFSDDLTKFYKTNPPR
jgi:hypothetical protein